MNTSVVRSSGWTSHHIFTKAIVEKQIGPSEERMPKSQNKNGSFRKDFLNADIRPFLTYDNCSGKLWLEYGGIMISACLVEGYIKHLVIRYRDGSEIGTG